MRHISPSQPPPSRLMGPGFCISQFPDETIGWRKSRGLRVLLGCGLPQRQRTRGGVGALELQNSNSQNSKVQVFGVDPPSPTTGYLLPQAAKNMREFVTYEQLVSPEHWAGRRGVRDAVLPLPQPPAFRRMDAMFERDAKSQPPRFANLRLSAPPPLVYLS